MGPGDGATDDTAAFQRVLDQFSGSDSIIFVDSGTYILTDTVTVPTGTRIVGEAWSQLAASGPNFSDATYVVITASKRLDAEVCC